VAALTGAPLKHARPSRRWHRARDHVLPVKVQAPDLCGRFSGRIVRGVEHQAKTPPGWWTAWRAAASAA
jgi:phenylalanyl-tRNA synthetase beta chain